MNNPALIRSRGRDNPLSPISSSRESSTFTSPQVRKFAFFVLSFPRPGQFIVSFWEDLRLPTKADANIVIIIIIIIIIIDIIIDIIIGTIIDIIIFIILNYFKHQPNSDSEKEEIGGLA